MSKPHKKQNISLGIILVFAAVLIGARLYLPVWLKDYVNEQIVMLDNYGGSVNDIDVYLWRGAYQIHGLNIHKKPGGLDKPFVAAETIDLSVEWGALFNGAVVAEIDVHEANLNFSNTQTGEGEGWARLVNALSPFDINRLEVHSGRLTYTSYAADPDIHLFIEDVNAKVTNLRQVTYKDSALPSSVKITGVSIGNGVLNVDGKMNILKGVPDFDLGMKLEKADLKAFNDYTNDYAGIDFESGNIDVFAELAAADGKIVGYVKPVATNVSVVSAKQDRNPLNALWESLASLIVELLENQPTDQFAMRIPIEGNLSNPEQGFWVDGFFSIFSNAFGQAFSKNEDGTINFEDALEKN